MQQMVDTEAKVKDPNKQQYPNWLNWVGAVLFVAMTVGAFMPDSGNWRYFPFTALMAFIFIKKGIEQRTWDLGDKLVMPVLCFPFVIEFILGIVNKADASTLWTNGGVAVLCILVSANELYFKPRRKKNR